MNMPRQLQFLVLHRLCKAPYDDRLLEFLLIDERLVDIGGSRAAVQQASRGWLFAPAFGALRSPPSITSRPCHLCPGDDLTDYEDDVEHNSFNVFRAFVFLYGRQAPIKLVELITDLEGKHAELLARLPDHWRAHHSMRHQQASAEPGSGRWIFPDVILDEEAFRKSLLSYSPH